MWFHPYVPFYPLPPQYTYPPLLCSFPLSIPINFGLFSHFKSLYGFTLNVGSVIYCWPVLYIYVGNLENSQWFSVSFHDDSLMLPFFTDTATVSTKPADNPACGGVLPERMMGIALRSPRHSPSHRLLGTCSHLFVCLTLMQKTVEIERRKYVQQKQ